VTPAAATHDLDRRIRYHDSVDFRRKDEHHHMQELRDRLQALRDRIAHVMVRL
jgi:hypothetical protein